MNGKTMTGMGLACGICCALPMLIAAGALSLGTAAFAGIAAAAASAPLAISARRSMVHVLSAKDASRL